MALKQEDKQNQSINIEVASAIADFAKATHRMIRLDELAMIVFCMGLEKFASSHPNITVNINTAVKLLAESPSFLIGSSVILGVAAYVIKKDEKREQLSNDSQEVKRNFPATFLSPSSTLPCLSATSDLDRPASAPTSSARSTDVPKNSTLKLIRRSISLDNQLNQQTGDTYITYYINQANGPNSNAAQSIGETAITVAGNQNNTNMGGNQCITSPSLHML